MRNLPPLAALIAFEAAARHESFLAAANELHLTPSAVSHQVKNLEVWCGRRLFVRATRRLFLTEDGRRLLQELGPALDAIHEACTALRPAARRAHLAVHCAPSFAAKWLGPRLPQVLQAHPTLTIRLSSGPDPVDFIKAPEIDLHIAYGEPPEAPGVVVEDLGPEITAPLCSPKLLPADRPIEPDLLGEAVLIESQLNPIRWSDWCRRNGVKPSTRARPSFDRGALAVAAAVDGLGVALETVRFAETELQRGTLVALDGPGFQTIRRPLHFVRYREIDRNHPDLRTFLGWLKAELARESRR
jgi:LysR family transcriptional regulator, glycine cleavage system transcriptional activator